MVVRNWARSISGPVLAAACVILMGFPPKTCADNGTPNPDASGYVASGTFVAPTDANAPTYSFTDISGTGTLVPGMVDESSNAIPFPVGFAFTFYGTAISSINVCDNGYIQFGGSTIELVTGTIPAAAAPNGMVAAYWDDLDPDSGGSVRYQVFGAAPSRTLVIQWTAVPRWGEALTDTFQIKLFETTNVIECHYSSITSEATTFGNYTIGIENTTGTVGVAYRNTSTTLVPDGVAVRFLIPAPTPTPTPAPVTKKKNKSSSWWSPVFKKCFVGAVDDIAPLGALAALALLGTGVLLYPRRSQNSSAHPQHARLKKLSSLIPLLSLALCTTVLWAGFQNGALVVRPDGSSTSAHSPVQSLPATDAAAPAAHEGHSAGMMLDRVGTNRLDEVAAPGEERASSRTGPDFSGFQTEQTEVLASMGGSQGGSPSDPPTDTIEAVPGPSTTEGGGGSPDSESQSELLLAAAPASESLLEQMAAMMSAHRDDVVAEWTSILDLSRSQQETLRSLYLEVHTAKLSFRANPPKDNYAIEFARVKGLGKTIFPRFRESLTAEQRVILDPRMGQ